MAITMTNWVLTWTDPKEERHGSAVSYDEGSAKQRKQELEAAGCTEVEITEAKPGELPKV